MLDFGRGTIRSWRPLDQAALAAIANDRSVWRNFRDQFPHPYTEHDARRWIAHAIEAPHMSECALEVGDQVAGGIGIRLQSDIHRTTGILGYWLGQPFRGRGIATAAVGAFVSWAMTVFHLARVEARVFVWNDASSRTLQRTGFVFEGVHRQVAWKDGQFVDEAIYALLNKNFEHPVAGSP